MTNHCSKRISFQCLNFGICCSLVIFAHPKRQWQPTPVLWLGRSHGRRSLVGCSPWGCWESDKTEWHHFHFSLSCIGEGYGNPLQCSCLENPRDRGAWWASVSGVAQSRTRLKRLSSFLLWALVLLLKTINFYPISWVKTWKNILISLWWLLLRNKLMTHPGR